MAQEFNLTIKPYRITAFIGPSGIGKPTVPRALNRPREGTPNARIEVSVLIDGHDIYGVGVDVVPLRRLIGMVFQQPNPFPAISIYENVPRHRSQQRLPG